MTTIDFQPEALHELLRRERVVTKARILDKFRCSPMTVWRGLRQVGYFSSISHNARYYTAADVPAFDANGLWSYRDIYFSRFRTLPETVIALVENSEAGMDVRELNELLSSNLSPMLSTLWRERRVMREEVNGRFVHLALSPERRTQQLAARQKIAQTVIPLPVPETVIAVLVALLRGVSRNRKTLARRIRRQGIAVTDKQIEAIFTHYGLSKKKYLT